MSRNAAGFRVVGLDIDTAKAKALMAGKSYIKHIPASSVVRMHKGGRFVATTDFRGLRPPSWPPRRPS